jgi:hypothetical protein
MTGLDYRKYIQLGRAFERAFEASEEYRAIADTPAANVSDADDLLGRAYARAICSVERRMRAALAAGELEPLVRDSITGEPVALTDREKWTRPPKDMHHGLGTFVNHLTNPGPETNGRAVHLERAAFQQWLTSQAGENQQATASSAEPSVAPGSSAPPNGRLHRQDIEGRFRKRVTAFEAEGRRPTSADDVAFLMNLGCKRLEAREIRKAIVPVDWQEPGAHRKANRAK